MCRVCEETKHAANFRRGGKASDICNECLSPHQTKHCPTCGQEKHIMRFQREGRIYQSCNDCRLIIEVNIAKSYELAFSVLNKFALMSGISGEDNGK